MPRVMAKVTPALLTWAREDAGFSIEAAAKKLKIAPEKLKAWEDGAVSPTLAKARSLAELYRRPLALFYLKEEPAGFQVMHDFRRLPGEVAGVLSPALRLEIRRAQERRQTALDLFADTDDRPLEFRLNCSMSDEPESVAARLREFLGVTADLQLRWRTPGTAWPNWRQTAESVGVLVFLTTTYSPTEARGFSIAEPVLPVIGVNRKDVPAARCFTLLHELTHLMLRVGGICDLDERYHRPLAEDRVEVFCNAVAGAALVPRDLLLAHPTVTEHRRADPAWTEAELAEIAARFGCSREVILRRLLRFQRTSRNFYQERRDQYENEARKARDLVKSRKLEIRRNIPSETVSILGRPFLRLALANYSDRRMTLNDLSELLGVKSRHVSKIAQRLNAAA